MLVVLVALVRSEERTGDKNAYGSQNPVKFVISTVEEVCVDDGKRRA